MATFTEQTSVQTSVHKDRQKFISLERQLSGKKSLWNFGWNVWRWPHSEMLKEFFFSCLGHNNLQLTSVNHWNFHRKCRVHLSSPSQTIFVEISSRTFRASLTEDWIFSSFFALCWWRIYVSCNWILVLTVLLSTLYSNGYQTFWA